MATVRFGLGADHACGVDTGCRSDFLPVFLESRGSQPVNTISEPFTTAYRKSLDVNKLLCSGPAPDAFGLQSGSCRVSWFGERDRLARRGHRNGPAVRRVRWARCPVFGVRGWPELWQRGLGTRCRAAMPPCK